MSRIIYIPTSIFFLLKCRYSFKNSVFLLVKGLKICDQKLSINLKMKIKYLRKIQWRPSRWSVHLVSHQ